ncbi:MAG TPA: ParB/RepB/Spo0J family partition protein [Thermoanaerobaculia bacterium]|nr:ParB/RepB/Spo0J family partition protein [Thermoanaerobaculia bacterium]
MSSAEPRTAEAAGEVFLEVLVERIAPDPDQPRRGITAEDLEPLAASLKARGLIQPLLVSPHPQVRARLATPYMLISGERRWAAARLAGLPSVRVVLREEPLSPSERLMLQLDENDGELRREVNVYDRATALVRALQAAGIKKEEFARRYRKSPAWMSHQLALARAEGWSREALREGWLTGIVAAALFMRLGPDEQRRLLAKARRLRKPISGHQIEAAAQRGARREEKEEEEGERSAGREGREGGEARGAGGNGGGGGGWRGEGAAVRARPPGSLGMAGTVAAAGAAEGHGLGEGQAAGGDQEVSSPRPGEGPIPVDEWRRRHAGAAPGGEQAADGHGAAGGQVAGRQAAGENEGSFSFPGGAGVGAGVEGRSAVAGFLDAGQEIALGRRRSGAALARRDEPRFSISFSPRQLEALIVLLGEEPLGTREEQIRQLFSFLP